MAYRLEYLDQLVKATAAGSQGAVFTLSEADKIRLLQEALEATANIREQLVQDVFGFTKEKEIEVYIKNYQVGCTHLLDRLYSQEQQLEPGQVTARFYTSFYQSILSLLSFIEERFSKYFDKTEKVPDVYLALTKHEIAGKQAALHLTLEQSTEPSITAPLRLKIDSFVHAQATAPVSYRDIMFYKELIKELEDVEGWKKTTAVYSGLQCLLIYLNYNAKEFINVMVNRVVAELQSFRDVNDKMDHLFLYAKTINQLQLKPDSGLFPNHPSVKTQLSNWFAEELHYLERKLGALNTANHKTADKPIQKQKIVCQLPVDQLGIFFRAAADLHIIDTPNQKQLFEQIVPWISTMYKKDLSADSMRSKSYAPEKKDIEAVKEILMKFFRQVNHY